TFQANSINNTKNTIPCIKSRNASQSLGRGQSHQPARKIAMLSGKHTNQNQSSVLRAGVIWGVNTSPITAHVKASRSIGETQKVFSWYKRRERLFIPRR